jgi:hypothetical protein
MGCQELISFRYVELTSEMTWHVSKAIKLTIVLTALLIKVCSHCERTWWHSLKDPADDSKAQNHADQQPDVTISWSIHKLMCE